MKKLRNPSARAIVVRPTHPNAGVTARYRQELEDLLQAMYLDAAMGLPIVWSETPPTVGLAQDASSTAALDRYLKKWGSKWQSKFDRLSAAMSKRFSSKSFQATEQSMRASLAAAGFTVSFKPTAASMEAYRLTVADNVALIRSLPSTFVNRVQQDVWASVRAGGDLATLSRKLHKSYGIEGKRAVLIARDQNAKAKAIIENTRRKELGITEAIWHHSSAGKEPRPLHQKWGREKKRFNLETGMWDSDENEYVLPGQLINCRCSSSAVIKAFEEINAANEARLKKLRK